jgi:hypothetical protein
MWVNGAILDLTGDVPVVVEEACGACKSMVSQLRKWGDGMMCRACYEQALKARTDELNAWLESVGLKGCAFCGKVREDPREFHFDHIDMFTKEGSVGEMLFSGADMEVIKAEVRRCQLLCVDCHAIVTKAERGLGFMYLKRFGKRRVDGLGRDEYMMVMPAIYEAIKQMRGREAGLGGK